MTPVVYFKGQKVRHPAFGWGTVRVVSSKTATLKVFFDLISNVETIPVSSLVAASPLESAPHLLAPLSTPERLAEVDLSDSSRDVRRLTIECLRQGLPPPGKLTSWTVGHEESRRAIDGAIAEACRGKGTAFLLRAGYGQGKSHLGRLGCELAREQGLASFQVELDGKGVSLAHGSRLVASLFASAQLPSTGRDHDHVVPGLATILRRAAPAAAKGLPHDLSAFAPFLEEPSLWAESDEVVELLERYLSGDVTGTAASKALFEVLGVRLTLESLKMDWGFSEDRRRKQAEQLGRIVTLVRLAGARGAFIVIDELDHDYQADVDKKNAFLSELTRVACSGPIVLLLLARELPMKGLPAIELGDFTSIELEQLVNKAVDAFAAVYPAPALAKGRRELFVKLQQEFHDKYRSRDWGPRFFVRAAIEACEATRSLHLDSLAQVTVSEGGRGIN